MAVTTEAREQAVPRGPVHLTVATTLSDLLPFQRKTAGKKEDRQAQARARVSPEQAEGRGELPRLCLRVAAR